jgi:hypothetical protein
MEPEFPFDTVVVDFMILATVPEGGFETLHEILVLQELALRGMVQFDAVMLPIAPLVTLRQDVPFHDVPDTHDAIEVVLASSLYL